MRHISTLILVVVAVILAGCDLGPKSSYGFTLPEGDAKYGQAYFLEYRCVDCHVVAGLEDELVAPEGIDPLMAVPLGGKTTRIQTYGELVTSIINPSHKVSSRYRLSPGIDAEVSPMRNYNSIMTVEELSDIVTFVQSQYELQTYQRTLYRMY